LIFIFNGTAFALMKLFRLHADHSHTHVHSPEELEALYRDSAAAGLIDSDERDLLSGALGVDDRAVREIMTPRVKMLSVAADAVVADALKAIIGSPYSRFPVRGAGEDDVVGIVHIRSLFLAQINEPETTVAEAMKPVSVVAEMMKVPALWQYLREKGQRSAIVINEYGSVAGLVTLEDVLEEIFGELQDEFDNEDEQFIQRKEGLSVRGDVSLAALSDRQQIDLPQEDADTVGGLVWHLLGHLPVVGERCLFEDVILTVEAIRGSSVERVLIAKAPEGGSQ
jgi:putative hemolysin